MPKKFKCPTCKYDDCCMDLFCIAHNFKHYKKKKAKCAEAKRIREELKKNPPKPFYPKQI